MMENGNAPARLERFFGPGHAANIEALPRAGLSGARIWRVRDRGATYALRCSPSGRPGLKQIAWAHRCMAATDLEYVPRPVASPTGPSCFEDADGVWELQTWVPGQATLSAAAPEELLLSAVETISRLHRAWSSLATQSSHSPTLRRRAQKYPSPHKSPRSNACCQMRAEPPERSSTASSTTRAGSIRW